MKNHLFLLSFCVLLSGCVHRTQQHQDVYAQSDLLPRKTVAEQSVYSSQTQQNALTLQGQQTPPIVVPQQTMLPPHVLANPQMPIQQTPQNNPTPFVQTIVIPQAAPYSYPNMMPMQQPTPVVSHNINGQQYPAQMYPNQVPTYAPAVQNMPVQTTYAPQNAATQPVWSNSQNIQQIQPEAPASSLNVPNTQLENIPRW